MRLMKYFLAAVIVLAAPPIFAHKSTLKYRPESHAPADVMSDHLHKQGEWMLGYRYMARNYGGIYYGSDKTDATTAAHAGYAMIATDMKMEMHMLDIMYAISNDITLMLMPQYMSMDMTMAATPAALSMSGHGSQGSTGGHQHSVSGVGDTIAGALIRLKQSGNHQLHTTLGVSIPTGSVDETMADGRFIHYGMQLGSGTWNFVPNLTYTGYAGPVSWGTQLGATVRLESENNSGFAVGDKYFATGWGAYRFSDWASVSLRLEYEKANDIDGHYTGAHNHSSPPDFQTNYGGEFIDLGLGINLSPQSGPFAGVRLGFEWTIPVAEYYNGFQIGRDNGLSLSLSYAL